MSELFNSSEAGVLLDCSTNHVNMLARTGHIAISNSPVSPLAKKRSIHLFTRTALEDYAHRTFSAIEIDRARSLGKEIRDREAAVRNDARGRDPGVGRGPTPERQSAQGTIGRSSAPGQPAPPEPIIVTHIPHISDELLTQIVLLKNASRGDLNSRITALIRKTLDVPDTLPCKLQSMDQNERLPFIEALCALNMGGGKTNTAWDNATSGDAALAWCYQTIDLLWPTAGSGLRRELAGALFGRLSEHGVAEEDRLILDRLAKNFYSA